MSAVSYTHLDVYKRQVLTIMTTKTTHHFRMDSNRLYEALMCEICNYMEGKPKLLAGPGIESSMHSACRAGMSKASMAVSYTHLIKYLKYKPDLK